MAPTRLPSVPEFAGAHPPRIRPVPTQVYPDRPEWFVNSLAEWVTYWWLSEGRTRPPYSLPRIRPVGPTVNPERGRTFFYQITLPVAGVNQILDGTRVDFWLPGFGGVGDDAIAIDPFNEWSHPNVGHDYLKRDAMGTQLRTHLIWIHTSRLEAGEVQLIEEALQGVDSSTRARLGI